MSAASPTLVECERRASLFGSDVRILVTDADGDGARLAALLAEALLRHQQQLLSRFDPASELARLNANPRETAEASPTMLAFLRAARWAYERSGGLVDATVCDAVERSGYRDSLEGRPEALVSLEEALLRAPSRRAAMARSPSQWDDVRVDAAARKVSRHPGVRFDSGGITKGHAADLAAAGMERFAAYAIDCGGDIRLGGGADLLRRVDVTDPWTGENVASFDLVAGGVATSGINRRLWRDGEGFGHHVIDPGRDAPAWTGLVQTTAVAPTALEAEVLSKAALLSGPTGAREWLEPWGGIAVADDGEWHWFGPLKDRGRSAEAE